MGQSSNDTFPTAMHIATLLEVREHMLPQLGKLIDSMWAKAVEWVEVVKIGRTHLQDAVPLTVGQEWSGWATQLRDARHRLETALTPCTSWPRAGPRSARASTPRDGFGEQIAAKLAELTGLPLKTAPNKFAAQGSLDGMVAVSAGLRGVAVALMKIANDMRWLASGPRAGLHELKLPANEPGSSIMPGKVNPTQQEAMVMVCLQVIGEDSIVASAGAQGNFELNAMRPIIINNVLHCARILGDACEKLRRYSVEGTELDRDKVSDYVGRSLMLVTALSPSIGYDKASAIAHKADDEGTSLREAALALGVSAADFDRIVDPKTMVGDPRRDLGLESEMAERSDGHACVHAEPAACRLMFARQRSTASRVARIFLTTGWSRTRSLSLHQQRSDPHPSSSDTSAELVTRRRCRRSRSRLVRARQLHEAPCDRGFSAPERRSVSSGLRLTGRQQ